MTKIVTQKELDYIISQHSVWLSTIGARSGGEAGSRVSCRNESLQDLIVQDAELNAARFENSNLQRTRFMNVNMSYASCKNSVFRNVIFRNVNFRGAVLRHADFQNSVFQDVDAVGADFRSADFRGADLQGSSFRQVDFRHADLRGANLRDVNMAMSDLCYAKIDISIRECMGFVGAKFTSDALPWLILHPYWETMSKPIGGSWGILHDAVHIENMK